MTFFKKLRVKNSNCFGAIGRSQFEEPKLAKEFRKECSNKVAEKTFHEFRFNSISNSFRIYNTNSKLETEFVRKKILNHIRVCTNKSRQLTKKVKIQSKANLEVEKKVKTAIETMRKALEKTKTAVQDQVEISQETLVKIVDNVVDGYKMFPLTVNNMKELVKTLNFNIQNIIFDINKTQQTEIRRAVKYNIVLAELTIEVFISTGVNVEILIISDILKMYLLQAVIEKQAESTAKVTADAEAKAVIRSLIELIQLFSQPKAKNKYPLKDPLVAVRPLESVIDFVKKEVLGSIIHIFGTSYKIAYPLQHKVDDRMREEAEKNYSSYIKAISYIDARIHIIEELSKKHINDSITREEIDLKEKYKTMKWCIPVFIAGIGNLQRLADEVEKQNETITSAQLNALRCCLVKILRTISALVFPGEFRNKTVEICDEMETFKRPWYLCACPVTIH